LPSYADPGDFTSLAGWSASYILNTLDPLLNSWLANMGSWTGLGDIRIMNLRTFTVSGTADHPVYNLLDYSQDQLVEIPHSGTWTPPPSLRHGLCGAVWPRPRQLSHLVASDPGFLIKGIVRGQIFESVAKISLLVGNARKLAQGIQSRWPRPIACAQTS